MPYLITCPNCSAKLKSGQPVPAGRALNCPQCKSAFTLSDAAPEIDVATTLKEAPMPVPAETAKAPAPVPSPVLAKPNRTPSPTTAELSPRKGRTAQGAEILEAEIVDAADFDPRRSRDDDDRPRSRRRDRDDDDRPLAKSREDDERPRSRGRDEDDDDRPRRRKDEDDRPARSKRRHEDDRPSPKRPAGDFEFEDDDKPKARRSRNDEVDEDRPKARRARDEEEDMELEEDTPRSSSRSRYKKGKKGNRILLIALLGGGAGVLLVLFLLGFYFIDPFKLFGGASSEMLAWAPADTEAIMVLDVAEARKLDDFKDGMGGNADGARHGIRADEISTMLVASRSGMGGQEIVVYKLISSADQAKIISAVNGKEASANGKKYYRTVTNGGLYFPSSRLVVVAQSENTLQTLLLKSESSVIVSEDMRSAAKRASGIFTMASVGKTAAGSDLIALLATQGGMFGPGAFGGKGTLRSATARSFVYSLKVSGDRGTGTMTSTYDNSDTARRISEDLRKNMDQNPTLRGEIDSFEVSQSGSAVTLTLRGPVKGKKTFMPLGLR